MRRDAGRLRHVVHSAERDTHAADSLLQATRVAASEEFDMIKSRLHQLPAVIAVALSLATGCTTVDGTAPKTEATPGVEHWICGDYYEGCGLFSSNCVTLVANLRNGTGEVKFSSFVERTEFRIDGIERRWNWCMQEDYSYRCSFIISVDGTGSYYNFGGTDGTAKPRDLFKCTKR